MGKDRLPGFNLKRKLLYSKNMPPEEITEAADVLLEAEEYDDALDLYEKSGNLEKVRLICQKAFSEGDVGVWLKSRRILKEPIQAEEWQQIAGIALMAGKEHFALFAYQRAGDEAKAEEVRQKISARKGPTAAPPTD